MIKRVNSTGRRRIPRNHVEIEVLDGDPRLFNGSVDLSEFDAPPDAEVVLEATCAGSTTVCRYPWGTIGEPNIPNDRLLKNLHGKHVFFTLKVIDRSEEIGRILGMAENIRPIKGGPKTATGRKGILPVEQADLGEELWKLEFRSEDVFLLVNERVPELVDRMRFDKGIYALVYPSIIREVLSRAFQEQPDTEDADDHWPSLWLRFGTQLHPEQVVAPLEEEVEEIQREWIEEIVAAFCKEHDLRQKFSQATTNTVWDSNS